MADLQPVDLVAYISSSRFFPQHVLSPKMLCFCSTHGNLKMPLSSYNSKDMTLDIYSCQRKHTCILLPPLSCPTLVAGAILSPYNMFFIMYTGMSLCVLKVDDLILDALESPTQA